MDMTQDSSDPQQSPESAAPSGFGIARDVRQLRTQGKATADELRVFLAQARGRSAQEVLGMVAGSRLTQSIAQAALGAVLLLAVCTIVPWLLSDKAEKSPASANAAATPPASTETSNTAQTPTELESATTDTNAAPSPADAQEAVKVMGLGDTKTADPKSNPLENKLDNLLDDLE